MYNLRKILFLIIFIFVFEALIISSFAEEKKNSDVYYGLQVGFFMVQHHADRLKDDLLEKGFEVIVLKDNYFKVLVGPYKTESEAREVLPSLRKVVPDAYLHQLSTRELIDLNTQKNFKKDENGDNFSDKKNLESNHTHMSRFIKSLSDDHIIQGFFGQVILPINLSEKKPIEDGVLHLYYNHSKIKEYSHSSITIRVNEKPIYSFFLNDSDKENYKKIIIPKDILLEESKIEILTFHRLTDEVCEFEENPALWVTVLEETHFEIGYEKKQRTTHFPIPFLPYEGHNFNFYFVLDEIHPRNIEAMYTISYQLGTYRNSPLSMEGVKIKLLSDLSSLEEIDENFIYIGGSHFTGFLPENVKNNLEDSQLGLFQHTENGVTGLFLVSNDKENLNIGSRIFLREDFVKEFNRSIILEKEEIPFVMLKKQSIDSKLTFENFGYGDFNLKGADSSVEVFMQAPYGYALGKNNRLVIDSYHHPAFDNGGEMTVFINEQPIGSYFINSDSENNQYVFDIPPKFAGLTDFNLKISQKISIKNPCLSKVNVELWSFISNHSYLEGPFEENKENFFESFPRTFVSIHQTHFDALVFSEEPSNELLKETLEFIYSISKPFSSTLKPFSVFFGEDPGSGSRIFFYHSVNDVEGFSLKTEVISGRRFLINENEDTRFLKKDSTLAGAQLALINESYNMLFLGADEKQLIDSIRMLIDSNKGAIIGDTFFIDYQGNLKSGYLLSDREDIKREEHDLSFLENEENTMDLKIFLIGGFVILVILVFLALTLNLDRRGKKSAFRNK